MDKIITIQEAIKAMDSGNTGKCLSNGLFYRRSNDVAGIHYYEMSASPDFSHIERVQCKWFDSLEIFSEWEIIEQDEKPKPCIYCQGHTRIVQFSKFDKYKEIFYFKVICNDKYIHECDASSPSSIIKQKAILRHNELYNKLYNKESENFEKVSSLYELINESRKQRKKYNINNEYIEGNMNTYDDILCKIEELFPDLVKQER